MAGPAALLLVVALVTEAGDEPVAGVTILVLVLAALPVLPVVAAVTAAAVLVLRTEIAGAVAGLRGRTGVLCTGFGAGRPLGTAPEGVLGAARVLRPGRLLGSWCTGS